MCADCGRNARRYFEIGKRVETSGADLAEWRVDWYESVFVFLRWKV